MRGACLGRWLLAVGSDHLAVRDDHLRVVRVRQPETIADPKIAALILEAIAAVEYPGTMPEALYKELTARVAADDLGIFVGFQGPIPMGVAVVQLPTSRAMIAPQALLIYSAGEPALARRVGERVRIWVMTAGYDRVIGVNLNRSDAVFCRGLRHFGKPIVLGSLIAFKF